MPCKDTRTASRTILTAETRKTLEPKIMAMESDTWLHFLPTPPHPHTLQKFIYTLSSGRRLLACAGLETHSTADLISARHVLCDSRTRAGASRPPRPRYVTGAAQPRAPAERGAHSVYLKDRRMRSSFRTRRGFASRTCEQRARGGAHRYGARGRTATLSRCGSNARSAR